MYVVLDFFILARNSCSVYGSPFLFWCMVSGSLLFCVCVDGYVWWWCVRVCGCVWWWCVWRGVDGRHYWQVLQHKPIMELLLDHVSVCLEVCYYLPKFHFGKYVRLTVCLFVCLSSVCLCRTWYRSQFLTNHLQTSTYVAWLNTDLYTFCRSKGK